MSTLLSCIKIKTNNKNEKYQEIKIIIKKKSKIRKYKHKANKKKCRIIDFIHMITIMQCRYVHPTSTIHRIHISIIIIINKHCNAICDSIFE